MKPNPDTRREKTRPATRRAVPILLDPSATPPEEQPRDCPPQIPNSPYDADPTQSPANRGALTLYLREIGQVKRLTQQEELELAARIRRGDKAARERMITANLRLVVKIAQDYSNLGVPLLDLISEGNIGLMKAVERFDPAKGAKFSSYACWWIKQAVKRALATQSKTIRLPVYLAERINHLNRVSTELHQQLGFPPTDDAIGRQMQLPAFKISSLRAVASRPTPLDAPADDETAEPLAARIADPNAKAPDEILARHGRMELLSQALRRLTPRELEIVTDRFGLGDAAEATLDDVGRKMGLTRERIRQIQNHALAKLGQHIEESEAPQAHAA